jgi:hypothetical protein
MGGASDEPTYMFNDADARSPFERFPNFGFRLAKYSPDVDDSKAADPVTVQTRDFSREKPVSDLLYQAYKSLCSYDKTPLRAVVESAERTAKWKRRSVRKRTSVLMGALLPLASAFPQTPTPVPSLKQAADVATPPPHAARFMESLFFG